MQRKAQNKVQEYFFYFMLYSIIGWIYEVFLEVVIYRWGFSNRGILFGPYCIIYGVGALILIFSLRKLQRQHISIGKINVTPVLVFLGIVLITTGVELVGSYIMEAITGKWMWDYQRFTWNFQGRIALNPSIRFGIGGMIFLYVLQPLFEKLTKRLPDRIFKLITAVMGAVFLIDIIVYFTK